MITQPLPVEVSAVQAAIYHLALSLDAFLLNGIQYGVLQQAVFPGFLQKTSGNLLRDLTALEVETAQAPSGSQPPVTAALAALKTKGHLLIDQVSRLVAFRTLPRQEIRLTIAQIQLLREELSHAIQELESCFGTPQPFYQTRPSDSTATVTEFLANLERMVSEA